MYAWGSNEFGQLGTGLGPVNVSKPTLVITLDGLPISYIACGGYHSFVVSKSGKINRKYIFKFILFLIILNIQVLFLVGAKMILDN